MGRDRFQDRLARIQKTRAVARHELQKQPVPDRGEHVEDAVTEPFYLIFHIAYVGVFATWLLIDFTTALPYAILGAVLYVVFVAGHTIWRAVHGSPNRKKEARDDIVMFLIDWALYAFRR